MSARNIWFVNFREKVQGGDAGIGHLEEEDVLWKLILEGTMV